MDSSLKFSTSKEAVQLVSHVAAYPLIYNHRSVVNDYLLREVVELLRKRGADARLTPFHEWDVNATSTKPIAADEGGGVLLQIHDEPIRLIGGMLLAGGTDYLFDASPFIEKRVKDVRCRFGYAGGEALDVLGATAGGVNAANSATDDLDDSPTLPGKGPMPSAQNAAPAPAGKFQYDSDRQKVYFQLREYSGISAESDEWIVQTLQVIGKNGPQGKVVYRSHMTQAGVARANAVRANAHVERPVMSMETTRMPVAGEEYLREANPELFEWCLKRDPVEMGAAITVIRCVIDYYKHSFTVIRTVRSLLRSIRVMQRFARSMIARRRTALMKMLRDWTELEVAFRERLLKHKSLPGDEIDRIVNKMLLQRCTTTVAWKQQVIREIWETKKKRYVTERVMAGFTRAMGIAFSWWIDPKELMAVQQKTISDSMSQGSESVFNHPKVHSLFIDSVGEKEIVRQAIAEARDLEAAKLDGRRIPAFGSTVSRRGGPEHALTVHAGPPTAAVRSWDLRNYTDAAAMRANDGDDNDRDAETDDESSHMVDAQASASQGM